MQDIQIIPTATETQKYDLRGVSAIIIDVLRASTTILTLLEMGISRIFPISTKDEAFSFKRKKPDTLLIGERHGIKPEGFDYGNSPIELINQPEAVFNGKDALFTTTNGTKALIMAERAESIFIASMRNLNSVALEIAKIPLPVRIICAGTNGEFSMEDYYCAGKLVHSLLSSFRPIDDLTWLAEKLSIQPLKNIVNSKTCRHVSRLKGLGFERDVQFSFELDKSNILPIYDKEQGCIIKYDEKYNEK